MLGMIRLKMKVGKTLRTTWYRIAQGGWMRERKVKWLRLSASHLPCLPWSLLYWLLDTTAGATSRTAFSCKPMKTVGISSSWRISSLANLVSKRKKPKSSSSWALRALWNFRRTCKRKGSTFLASNKRGIVFVNRPCSVKIGRPCPISRTIGNRGIYRSEEMAGFRTF